MLTANENRVACRRVGKADANYFFGYYNKSNWDASGRYLLANRVPMMDANLTPDMVAQVGFFDLENDDSFHVLGETTTWNWQMGCQLQWLGNHSGKRVIYNIRTDNKESLYPGFGSRVVDVESGALRDLPLPVYSVAPDGSYAISVDYSRLYITHQTIGYAEAEPPTDMPLYPEDDGLWRMDIETGQYSLIVSYADLRKFQPVESMQRALHWVSHIEISPDSRRILFLHRWTERVEDELCFLHRLITINADGSDMLLLECSDHPLPQLQEAYDPTSVGALDYEKSEYQISHPFWVDSSRIVVWGPHADNIHYHIYEDAMNGQVSVVGRHVLTENGHMSFSPVDPRWLLSDTYPDTDTNQRALFLFDMETEQRHDLGYFYTPDLKKENRCDLHPRWRPDGRQVCIDSVHEGSRQMYILDVSSITAA